MSACERLQALDLTEAGQLRIYKEALSQLVALVEAAEREGSGVEIIRALGFVGNAHYCPDCMNHFHDTCGQHEPGCSVLAGLLADEEWFDPSPFAALAQLDEALSGGTVRDSKLTDRFDWNSRDGVTFDASKEGA